MGERPLVALVAAVARNGVIGRGGALPWRLRSDLRRFREVTMGKPVVMGRRTYESIGRPLAGRANIVLTRRARPGAEGIETAPGLARALARAAALARGAGVGEIMVIGGAGVYAEALAGADRIYLTEVDARVDGDVRFPELDEDAWREVSRDARPAGDGDDFAHAFVVLERSPRDPDRLASRRPLG